MTFFYPTFPYTLSSWVIRLAVVKFFNALAVVKLQCFGSCETALHWQLLDCIALVVVFILLVVGRLHSIGSCKISLHQQLVDFIALAAVSYTHLTLPTKRIV